MPYPTRFAVPFLVLLSIAAHAVAADVPVPGTRMRLVDGAQKRTAFELAKPGDPDSGIDLTVSGATAQVFAAAASAGKTFALPASGWRKVGPRRYRYRNPGGTVTARLHNGRFARLLATGADAYALGGAQGPVTAIFDVGGSRFCGTFGGDVKHDDGTRFVAKDAPAPTDCTVPAGGCVEAADCPGSGCGTATCGSFACGLDPVAQGDVCRPVADQCDREEVCDGTSTDCPTDETCGCTVAATSAYGWDVTTASSIVDLTTGNAAAPADRQTNLQSQLELVGDRCLLDVDLVYGCYSAEFLFAEINQCVAATGTLARTFKITAAELGVDAAAVNLLQQLGGADVYYPGAYTASGLVTDGTLNVVIDGLTGKAVLNGLAITPLVGCLFPTPTPSGPQPSPVATVIDFGAGALPSGVHVSCGPSPTPTPSPTPSSTPSPTPSASPTPSPTPTNLPM